MALAASVALSRRFALPADIAFSHSALPAASGPTYVGHRRATANNMKLSFFERFGVLTILFIVLGLGGLLLFEHARDVHMKQGFLAAIEKGDEDQVKTLLDEGANPNEYTTKPVNKPSVGNLLLCTLPDSVRRNPDYKTTALMFAVMSKHGYLVSLLLDKGANVNATDEWGCTALTLAVSEGRLDMVQQLLEHGAAPSIPNASQMPLLNWAIMLREGPMVHALLDKGADANAQDGAGMSALYLACVDEDLPVARLLLDHKADPNTTHKGWSALHLCVEENNADITRLLLERGANANEKMHDGRTLLQLATEDKRNRVVPVLKQNGSKQADAREIK